MSVLFGILPSQLLAERALPGWRLSSINSTTSLRFSDRSSSLLGELSLNFGPGQQLKLLGRRSSVGANRVNESYGIAYRQRVAARHTVSFRSDIVAPAAGDTRASYGLGYVFRLPVQFVASTAQLRYRVNERINSMIELRYTVGRRLGADNAVPVTLSAASKWRQREAADGTVVQDVGGTVGLRLHVSSQFSVHANYNIRDQISDDIATVAATYAPGIETANVSIQFGVNSKRTAFFSMRTGL